MVSGVLPPEATAEARAAGARCEVLPRQGLEGGDLALDAALPTTVVPAGSAQACCEWRGLLGGVKGEERAARRRRGDSSAASWLRAPHTALTPTRLQAMRAPAWRAAPPSP